MSSDDGDFLPDSKFVERFNRLRKVNKFSDCSFKVENRVLSGHKLILSAASPVFEAMFYSKFSEGSGEFLNATKSIRIIDITHETFDSFLSYIYTGELTLKNDGCEINRLMELSYCAQKYLIEDMREQCLKKMTEYLNFNTIFMFLEKSFEMHLEDFLVSCLYFIADSLEAGASFNNFLMNNENFHLPPRCFEFLVKNLLDYLGECDNVLCLIKTWSLMQCQLKNLKLNDENQAVTLKELNLEDIVISKIVELKSVFVDPLSTKALVRISKSFHRDYYKPVRPLIVDKSELSFTANVSFKRFVIVNAVVVNSRLIPEQFDICEMNNQTYTENLVVELFEKASNKLVYKQQHIVDHVNFNGFFHVKLKDSLVLFPHHVYAIKLSWSDEAIGFEYPSCIFSLMEKGGEVKAKDNKSPQSIVQFHEYNYCYNSPFGSIIQGISYDLIS